MTTILYLLFGGVLAWLYIWRAQRNPNLGEMKNYAFGLIIAALIYLVFAVRGAAPEWLGLELLGVAIYGGVALLGLRYSSLLIALGWGLHPIWDALIHPLYTIEFVPTWYALACVSFDVVMAGYIVYRTFYPNNLRMTGA